MIPYIPEPVLHLGALTLSVFRITLVAAVLLGGYVMIKRACAVRMSGHLMFAASRWAIVFGLVGAHVAKAVMDFHVQFAAHPSMVLGFEGGIRSIGGLAGGLLGTVLYCRLRGRISWFDTFRILDAMAYAMPFGFAVGRLGCALVHDHRGVFTSSWMAVRFPEGARYDLGLIECVFLTGLSVVFWRLARRPRPAGFFIAMYGVTYGAFRIWLDTLHIQPYRFWEGAALAAMGIAASIPAVRAGRRADCYDRVHGSALPDRTISVAGRRHGGAAAGVD